MKKSLFLLAVPILLTMSFIGTEKKDLTGQCKTVLPKKSLNELSLTFNEFQNPIHIIGDQVEVYKFSHTLKISAKGLTQYRGNNIAFTLSLTLPEFNFDNNQEKTYANESNHFFDASKDAVLTFSIDTLTFGTIYRSKTKASVLSKIATTDYKISCKNLASDKKTFIINISVDPKSILRESTETKAKEEEATLSFSSESKSFLKVTNPQPSLPKVEAFKFNSSSEVRGKVK